MANLPAYRVARTAPAYRKGRRHWLLRELAIRDLNLIKQTEQQPPARSWPPTCAIVPCGYGNRMALTGNVLTWAVYFCTSHHLS
jgi:hypothetical protein